HPPSPAGWAPPSPALRERGYARCPEASRGGAADCEAVHPQGRLADADRHTLAVLAAGADPVVEAEVVADHRDLGQRVRAIADQGRALDRGTDFAVLDQVCFRCGEDEFAAGD